MKRSPLPLTRIPTEMRRGGFSGSEHSSASMCLTARAGALAEADAAAVVGVGPHVEDAVGGQRRVLVDHLRVVDEAAGGQDDAAAGLDGPAFAVDRATTPTTAPSSSTTSWTTWASVCTRVEVSARGRRAGTA